MPAEPRPARRGGGPASGASAPGWWRLPAVGAAARVGSGAPRALGAALLPRGGSPRESSRISPRTGVGLGPGLTRGAARAPAAAVDQRARRERRWRSARRSSSGRSSATSPRRSRCRAAGRPQHPPPGGPAHTSSRGTPRGRVGACGLGGAARARRSRACTARCWWERSATAHTCRARGCTRGSLPHDPLELVWEHRGMRTAIRLHAWTPGRRPLSGSAARCGGGAGASARNAW